MKKVTLAGLLVLTSVVWADTLSVTSLDSVQTIIESTEDGDWIILEPGLHHGPIIPRGRDLVIGSRYLLDGDTSWIEETVLLAGETDPDTASCAVYAYGETRESRLVGLVLRGSYGTWHEQADTTGGGCVYVNQASPTIEHCRFREGAASYGGAAFVAGIPFLRNAHLRILESALSDCSADLFGGGIYASHCSLTVEDSRFEGLYCNMAGAGISALTSWVRLESLAVHTCFGGIGGFELSGGWGAIMDCDFMDNATPRTGWVNDIALGDFWGTVTRCRFHDTHSPWPSVHIGGPYGETSFIGNVLEDNSTSEVSGTLISNSRNGNIISHNIFRDNHNLFGGAVLVFDHGDISVQYNTFSGNSSENPEQGGVLESNTLGNPLFENNIISGNVGNCITGNSEYPLILDARNNWWGHESGPYHAELNPLGLGDTLVGDSVLFEPWLTSPPDTTQPSAIRPDVERPVVGTWDLQSVFPNPFNNAFTLSLAGFAGRAFEISLFDILGRRVATLHSGPALGGLFTFTVSPELGSGVYFVAAHDDIVCESIKVVLLK